MAARIIFFYCRALLAAVFLYAGVVKVWDFQAMAWATPRFFDDILNYHLLPWYPAMVLAVFLPWLEIVTALALFTSRWRLGALLLILAQLFMFLGALASAWFRGLDIACGCFGHELQPSVWWIPLTRDLVLLAIAATALFLETSRPQPERTARMPLG